MKVSGIIATALLVVSIAANAYMVNERLEKKFYQKGRQDGAKVVTDKVIQQVKKTGRLTVTMPDGQMVVLTRQRPTLPPMAPAEKVVRDSNEATVSDGK